MACDGRVQSGPNKGQIKPGYKLVEDKPCPVKVGRKKTRKKRRKGRR